MEISKFMCDHSSRIFSKIDHIEKKLLSVHPSVGALIAQLLKNDKEHTEMLPAHKTILNNFLDMLSKEELIVLLIHIIEAKGVDDHIWPATTGGGTHASATSTDMGATYETRGSSCQSENERPQMEEEQLLQVSKKESKSANQRVYFEPKDGNLNVPDECKDDFEISDASLNHVIPSNQLTNSNCPSLSKPLKKRSCLRNDLTGSHCQFDDNGCENLGEPKKNISTDNRKGSRTQKVFTCGECNETFPSKLLRKKHLETHVYLCSICNKTFKSKDSLYHHNRGLHGKEKPYQCDLCDKSFSFHHSYKLHLQRHKGSRPYKCNLCPKTYLTLHHLKEHIQARHSSNSIVCHICGRKFSYNSALKVHLEGHSDGVTHSCETCGKVFKSNHALNRHQVHHKRNPFHCNKCGKYFKSDYTCNLHIRLHCQNKVKEKRFSCHICKRSFFHKCSLESHLQTHNKIKSFFCVICGKAFKSRASLSTHKYVHNEGRAYSCSICYKSFKTKNCLLAHTKRHQNNSFHTCSICSKQFIDKGGLSKHTKTVHAPLKYFSCNVCAKIGTRADNMRMHVKSHRNEVGPTDNPADFISVHMKETDQPPNVSFPNEELVRERSNSTQTIRMLTSSSSTSEKDQISKISPNEEIHFPYTEKSDTCVLSRSRWSQLQKSSLNSDHAPADFPDPNGSFKAMAFAEHFVNDGNVNSDIIPYHIVPSTTGEMNYLSSNDTLTSQAAEVDSSVLLSTVASVPLLPDHHNCTDPALSHHSIFYGHTPEVSNVNSDIVPTSNEPISVPTSLNYSMPSNVQSVADVTHLLGNHSCADE